MENGLKEKMNTLMYFMTKECARMSFVEFLEGCDISKEEYEEIKLLWKTIGIEKTYV